MTKLEAGGGAGPAKRRMPEESIGGEKKRSGFSVA